MILRLEEVCAGSKGERTQRVMIFTPACSLSAGLGLSFLVNCGISEHSLVLQESRILRFNHGLFEYRRENNYFYVLFECGRGENARNES